MTFALRSLCAVCIAVLLVACSPSEPGPGGGQQAPAVNAKAQSDLAMYQGLIESGSYELAAPIGAGLVRRYPNTAAAAEVRKSLAEVQAKADKINADRRLAALWIYQTGEQSGGAQSTASIHPSRPARDAGRIQLILRRHADWGESAYLYDNQEAGFVCPGRCDVSVSVDGGKPESWSADLPGTTDPAMFIDDLDKLVKVLKSAKTIDIEVTTKGEPARTLHFEVDGFDPEQWLALP